MQAYLQQTENAGRVVTLRSLSDTRYYLNTPPTGTTALPVPAGAKFVLVRSMSAEVWYKLGTVGTITVAAPTADLTDGSAPGYVAAGDDPVLPLGGATFLALVSAGKVMLEWFA